MPSRAACRRCSRRPASAPCTRSWFRPFCTWRRILRAVSCGLCFSPTLTTPGMVLASDSVKAFSGSALLSVRVGVGVVLLSGRRNCPGFRLMAMTLSLLKAVLVQLSAVQRLTLIRRCSLPALITVFHRRLAGPAFERPVKGAGLGKTGQVDDFINGFIGTRQQAFGQIAAVVGQ